MKGGVAIASVNELIVLSASADAAAAVAGTTMSSGVGGRSDDTLFPRVRLLGRSPMPARFQPASDIDSFLPSLALLAAHLLDATLVIVGVVLEY